jgi:hypothetical protein
LGWVLTRQVFPALHLDAELVHQTATTKGGRDTTGIGFGLRYDLNDTSWYASILFTF